MLPNKISNFNVKINFGEYQDIFINYCITNDLLFNDYDISMDFQIEIGMGWGEGFTFRYLFHSILN